ncbi:hypothetical protein KR054_010699, partial [Drosophila jambulina]
IMLQQPKAPQKCLVGPTYGVTLVMLIIGQMQVIAVIEIETLNDVLGSRYAFNLLQFFVSFLTIQLYGFFYRIIVSKPMWVRVLAGAWTVSHCPPSLMPEIVTHSSQYQMNTISIMKPTRRAPYFCVLTSATVTLLMMVVSLAYGYISIKHKRGLFISRHHVILWSERLFVLTCFGIIITAEMERAPLELPIMIIYMLLSNVFVIIFGASLRRPHFYHDDEGDYILIGQLYYLNFFALYMSYVWTLDLILEVTEW